MLASRFSILLSRKPRIASIIQQRSFWEFVNMMFNKPDPERIKQFGPDRACAEWVLRNGGKIVGSDGMMLSDYNLLPPENQKLQVAEIDGADSGISHYGFPHLIGCSALKKIILHNCSYIDNRAIKGLEYGKLTLNHVQISKCLNVTDTGLKELKALDRLHTLVLFNLESVTNLEECKQYLHQYLPKCKIEGKK